MGLSKLKQFAVVFCAGIFEMLYAIHAQAAEELNISEIEISVVTDSMNVDPDVAQLVAGQGTKTKPVVLLFGGDQSSWDKVVTALQQAHANGCPVEALMLGSRTAEPDVQIFAKGQLMTNPIDPKVVSGNVLTELVCEITRTEYSNTLAPDEQSPSE